MALEFSSGSQQSAVIELYTSEGCSSCPPAERWLSSFTDHSEVFKRVIPMAFHVDYWNYLGWEDRFAKAAYSKRQRNMKRQGLLRGVYTPGVLVSSQEWRAWRQTSKALPTSNYPVGILTAKLKHPKLTVNFSREGKYHLHMAYLGMGLESKVTSGENNRRTLQHDFVVLHHEVQGGSAKKSNRWQLDVPAIPDYGQTQTALVVWLSESSSEKIVQAAAAILPTSKLIPSEPLAIQVSD